MSESRHAPVNDDDLLAKAIPIDELEEVEEEAIELVESESDGSNKIRSFETRRPNQVRWARKPNLTGTGAVHCKTFVAKMRTESIEHLDEQINEWLDAHPDCDVKFVTTSVGRLIGKTTEDALVVNVWV